MKLSATIDKPAAAFLPQDKMNRPRDTLEPCRSYQLNSNTDSQCRSDICINNNKSSYTVVRSATGSNITVTKSKHKEYYKRYEHDEVPVKDNSNDQRKDSPSVKMGGKSKKSITDSDLDRLEQNIYRNISQELQIDNGSVSSLESNIKFFKTTVQDIFNTFQSNLRDYDLYKKKLNEILNRTHTDSISDMENFIKDMIQNIISSEPSVQSVITNDNQVQVEVTDAVKDKESRTDTVESNRTYDASFEDDSLQVVVEAYKNDNYLTDSTLNDNSKSRNRTFDNRVNVYLLSSSTPCVIKMNNRNMMSEINIKDTSVEGVSSYVASTENIKKMVAKKKELEQYELQPQQLSDREIPVKVSFAKKNLCTGDDGTVDEKEIEETGKSFISKICNYICKKLRKNSL